MNKQNQFTSFLNKANEFLSEVNLDLVCYIFYDVLQLLHCRLERKAGVGKTPRLLKDVQLKASEITGILVMVDYLNRTLDTVNVEGQLHELFGPDYSEDDYLKYFRNYLVGELTDRYERLISITEKAIKYMYKDDSGGHSVGSSFFETSRGKRVPWIKHTIQNSKCVFKRTTKNKETLLYITKYRIPIENHQSVIDTLLVVVKRGCLAKNAPYEFKTAYTVSRHNQVLKKIEACHPAFVKK